MSRDSRDGTDVIYYSDIGLEGQGALRPKINAARYHRSRVKALLLLSDSVLIPFSHLLSMDDQAFKGLVGESVDFFRSGGIEFRLDESSRDIDDYTEAYKFRPGVLAESIDFKRQLLHELDIEAARTTYSGSGQSRMFRGIVEDYAGILGQDGLRDTLVDEVIMAARDSENKRDFDARVIAITGHENPIGEMLLRASNYAYYVVGARTDNAIISSNEFFNMRGLRGMGLDAVPNGRYVSSYLYDPDAFGFFLAHAGAISSFEDLDFLSYEDISKIKKKNSYKKFLKTYGELYESASELDELVFRYEREQYLSMTVGAIGMACLSAVGLSALDPSGYDALTSLLGSPLSEIAKGVPTVLGIIGNLSTASPLVKMMASLPISFVASRGGFVAEQIERVVDNLRPPLSDLAVDVQRAVEKNGGSRRTGRP